MQICLIQVPYTMGDEPLGSSKGPERLVPAGADKLIAAMGVAVTGGVGWVPASGFGHDAEPSAGRK
jgi:hypothetical protein